MTNMGSSCDFLAWENELRTEAVNGLGKALSASYKMSSVPLGFPMIKARYALKDRPEKQVSFRMMRLADAGQPLPTIQAVLMCEQHNHPSVRHH